MSACSFIRSQSLDEVDFGISVCLCVRSQSLDEVQVAMETCDELRPMATTQPAYASGGRYGFSDKVIDGMTVTVNSCCVMFKSHAFEASVQVTQRGGGGEGTGW